MKKIYYVKVQFSTGLFRTQRKFFFETIAERAHFVSEANKVDVAMIGFGMEHLVSGQDALDEIEREKAQCAKFV